MLDFLNLKSETFGLDISDLSLKIVKLKKKRRGFDLASFAEQRIKPGIIQGGEIKDEDALAEVIKEGISKIKGEKLKTKYVVCSLPEEKGFLQVIQMPKLKGEELKKAVRYEAENYIPLPIDKVYLDSQIVPPIYNHLNHTDVLIVAFPKEIVDPYASCLKKAELQPTVLELECSAIARALVKNEVTPYPILLIDFGAVRTSFIIFSGYSLRFTTSISVSSRGLTKAIAKTLKIDLEQAEKLKLEYGLNRARAQGKKVFEALIPALTDLTKQIKKYFNYYHSHASHEHLPPNGKMVEKIFLCGGGANLKGLVDFLIEQLKIPVELGNPWMNILPKTQRETPQLSHKDSLKYTTALGLALGGLKGKYD